MVLAILAIAGCDEGMNMVDPVITEPAETPGEDQKPSSNGEMKQPGEDADPGEQNPEEQNPGEQNPGEQEPKEETPPPEPTITIGTVAQADDGSVTISGTSTHLLTGEAVTITLGDTVTATATTDNTGAWTVTVPATEAGALAAGTTAVTVSARGMDEDTSSFEHTVPEEVPSHGIVVSTEVEQIMLDIVIEVYGYNDETATDKDKRILRRKYDARKSQYGAVFEVGAEISAATAAFRRFVEYEEKNAEYFRAHPSTRDPEASDRHFEEAYGISADYARELVHTIYLEEVPEDRYLLRIRWQTFDIAMEHLLLRLANPDATEEEILELLRESIRAGKVTIAA